MTSNPSMPKIDLNPSEWEEVKRILKTHVPEYDVWAFGSRVTGTAKPYSDLDLAVITEHPLPLAKKADLITALEESDLTFRVDIVDWATTNEKFRRIIERDKVVVQEALKTVPPSL